MQHGYAKLQRGPEDFINVLHAMGLPVPFNLGWATIVVELVGGLMILVGALIPLATVPMATVLLVPIFTVHLPVKDGEQPDQHRCHGKREFPLKHRHSP